MTTHRPGLQARPRTSRLGRPVEFRWAAWRGDPPSEVFIEAKHGYEIITDPSKPEFVRQGQVDKFVTQAGAQLDAIGDLGGARLEWHFSSEAVADVVREAFERRRLGGVDVYFPPASMTGERLDDR